MHFSNVITAFCSGLASVSHNEFSHNITVADPRDAPLITRFGTEIISFPLDRSLNKLAATSSAWRGDGGRVNL